MTFFQALFQRWTWQMAYRDSRTHRLRLALFTTSIMLGSAALVGITSLRLNLSEAVQTQSKSLLGADLLIESRQAFSDDDQQRIDSLTALPEIEHAVETTLSAMAYAPKTGAARLSQLRAIDGAYPFYGDFDTDPKGVLGTLQKSKATLVDESLLMQFGLSLGDSLRLGEARFEIIGILREIPGEAAVSALIGPRIYISSQWLKETELIQVGSRVAYKHYFKLPASLDPGEVKDSLSGAFEQRFVSLSTAEERQAAIGSAMENLYRFLNLCGFISLLLGAIGIGSAINVYVRQKLANVATLRCLGASAGQAFAIYLIQGAALGLFGALGGSVIGLGIQFTLPTLLRDFFPLKQNFSISWMALFQGGMISFGVSVLFALLPIVSLRHVSPLMSLRSAYDTLLEIPKRDWAKGVLYGVIVVSVFLFSLSQLSSPRVPAIASVYFTLGLFLSFGVLFLFAKGLMLFLRRLPLSGIPFLFRQAISNLYRPNNQTTLLIVSLGLGTFLITTLFISQSTLLQSVALSGSNGQPNLVLFDIQPDQRQAVEHILETQQAPLFQVTPVVTLRLYSVKGRRLKDFPKDSIPSSYFWEFRATYRDTLNENESLISGTMPSALKDGAKFGLPLVSVSEFLVKDLKLQLGDTIECDVQGVIIPVQLGSVRRVEFKRLQPAFSLVFQEGVLNDAPSSIAMVTRSDSPSKTATLQRALLNDYANISLLDLSVVVSTIETILNKISLVIEFMAALSIATGLFVLGGAVVTSRYQRMRESILLKTLGASISQVRVILLCEYALLGILGSGLGVGLSVASTYLLSEFFFNAAYSPAILSLFVVLITITSLTLFIGWLSSRGTENASPLELLRSV